MPDTSATAIADLPEFKQHLKSLSATALVFAVLMAVPAWSVVKITSALADETRAITENTEAISQATYALAAQADERNRLAEVDHRIQAEILIQLKVNARLCNAANVGLGDDGALQSKPTHNQVVSAAMWGIDWSEIDTKNEGNGALSTTTIEALEVDLATNEQIEEYSQNLTIYNGDADDAICVAATAWGTACSAYTMTCRTGATTDGVVVYPGERRPLRFLGTERVCLEATAAISSYDVARMTYRGSEH